MDYAYNVLKMDVKKIWKTRESLKIQLEKPSERWISDQTNKILKKYPKLYERFKHIKNIIPLMLCYDHIGALGNISLSVSPKLKQRWKKEYKLSHELYGSFYNTENDLPYCSLFPEIESSDVKCNAFDFVPEKGKTYLVNPPFTTYHIRWSLEQILTKWSESNFIIIVPVWDTMSRKKLGLKEYTDIPELTELIKKYGKNHKIIKKFPFYNGVDDKDVFLKDPIHIFYIWNDKSKFSKTKKNKKE